MDRQPLTDFDRALLQVITAATLEMEGRSGFDRESPYTDRWEVELKCLNIWVMAHAADHPDQTWQCGIEFPVTTDERDDPVYEILEPEVARDLAEQLQQRLRACTGSRSRPWQWWQVSRWRWND